MFSNKGKSPFIDLLIGSTSPLELGGLGSNDLEEAIIELCAHLSSLSSKWLELIAEFDIRGLYNQWGCKSSAHWLSLKCGISLSTGYEHVRVARKMISLPQIHKCFANGEISYSKLRAITRVATQDNQELLVDLAKLATGSQLDQIVSCFSGSLQSQDLELEEIRYKRRYLTYRYDDDGSLVGFFRLPPESGALFVRALEAAKAELKRDSSTKPLSRGLSDGETSSYSPAEEIRNSIGETNCDSPAEENQEIQEIQYEPDSPAEEIRNSIGEANCDSPAQAPLDPAQADNPFGASNCDSLALISELALSKLNEISTTGSLIRPQTSVVIHMNESNSGNDGAVIQHGPHISRELARRLSCDAKLVRYEDQDSNIFTLNYARKRRLVTQRQKRVLQARDKGCRFPGCKTVKYTNAHHIIHWSDGGNTDLDNLVLLCSYHHHQVHEGGVRMEKDTQGYLHFYTKDGKEIENHSYLIKNLEESNRHFVDSYLSSQAYSHISSDTISPRWSGESFDLVSILDALYSTESTGKTA